MSWSLTNILSFLETFCVDESITRANLIQFISLRYDRVYNYMLDFYKVEGTFALVSGTRYYYLDRQLNLATKPKFYNQTNDNRPIEICDYDHILSIDTDLSETGTTRMAAFVELCQVQRQPNESSDSGAIGAKSSSSSDTSQKVTVSGLRTINSQLTWDTDEITLAGTTFTSFTKTGWHTLRVVSKSADTAGHVLVSVSDGGSLYSIIDPYADNAWYQKWRMWPTPDNTDTIRYTGHRLPIVPQNDSASLDVSPDMLAGFIQGLRADIHDINFDMIKAQKYEAKFEEALRVLRENNMWGDSQELVEGSLNTGRHDPRSELGEEYEDTEVV